MQTAPFQIQSPAAAKAVTKSTSGEVALRLAKIGMIKSGLAQETVAERLGITVHALRNRFSDGLPGVTFRFRLEAALDYQEPIESRPRELTLRKRCLQVHGFDPFLLSRPELIKRARQFGLRVLRDGPLPAIRGAVIAFLAVNQPNPHAAQ